MNLLFLMEGIACMRTSIYFFQFIMWHGHGELKLSKGVTIEASLQRWRKKHDAWCGRGTLILRGSMLRPQPSAAILNCPGALMRCRVLSHRHCVIRGSGASSSVARRHVTMVIRCLDSW